MLARIHAAVYAQDRIRRLFHFILAKGLFSLPEQLRKELFTGEQYYCPICENRLRKYLVLHRPYHLWCPVCRSLQRHRFIWVFYNSKYMKFNSSPSQMLHIAPEQALSSRFRRNPDLEYLSADLSDRSAMEAMDICDIRYPDNTFDIIICSHVLEHVTDDKKALREFWRILKSGGQAIILVPITTKVTFEDPLITDPVQREKLFGQHDHVRSYGLDFPDGLKLANFDVQTIAPEDLVQPDDIHRLGLDPSDTIFFCRKIS
jgi:hypothetical protein